MPDNADDNDNPHRPNAPFDLAAHRERRARLKRQQQQQRAALQAERDADPGADASGQPGPGMGPGEVPCVRCKQPVFGYALRCPHCGVHFSGRAEAFAPREGLSRRTRLIVALVAVALLLAGLSDDIAAWWR